MYVILCIILVRKRGRYPLEMLHQLYYLCITIIDKGGQMKYVQTSRKTSKYNNLRLYSKEKTCVHHHAYVT